MRLASALNRTLVLPRLRCGEHAMAYPCYAWYHRAMGWFGFNFDKVPMPDVCPSYYWLDLHRVTAPAAASRFSFREASFLENPRTPRAVTADTATLRLCAKAPCGPSTADESPHAAGSAGRMSPLSSAHAAKPGRGGGTGGGAGGPVVHHAYTSPASQLWRSLRSPAVERAAVLRVQHMQWLALPAVLPGAPHAPSKQEVSDCTRTLLSAQTIQFIVYS